MVNEQKLKEIEDDWKTDHILDYTQRRRQSDVEFKFRVSRRLYNAIKRRLKETTSLKDIDIMDVSDKLESWLLYTIVTNGVGLRGGPPEEYQYGRDFRLVPMR